MAKYLAIDLGTANTLVWGRGQGIVLDEPTVIAVDQRSGDVLAMGHDAYATVARAPGQILAERPLRSGAITDFDTTARLLRLLLQRAGASRFSRPRVLVCVSSALTDVERRAVQEAALEAGASACCLLEEPTAAAMGAGLPVHEARGSMVVDIGGGTSEFAVLSLGGIVVSHAVRTGGFDFDAAIQRYIRREYEVAIGERTAEQLKLAIASARLLEDEPKAEIRGRELSSGINKTVVVTADEIREAIEDNVAGVVTGVSETLGKCPPELTQDILETGLWLVGGGALLQGLDARISEETEVRVNLIDEPREAVVTGGGAALEFFSELDIVFA